MQIKREKLERVLQTVILRVPWEGHSAPSRTTGGSNRVGHSRERK